MSHGFRALVLVNGSTAMEGLSGIDSGSARCVGGPSCGLQRYTGADYSLFVFGLRDALRDPSTLEISPVGEASKLLGGRPRRP